MSCCTLLARILLTLVFLGAGVEKFQTPAPSIKILDERYPVVHAKFAELTKDYFPLPEQISPQFLKQYTPLIIQVVGGLELVLALGVILNIGFCGCLLALFTFSTIFIIHNPFVFNTSEEQKFKEYLAAFKNLGLIGALWLIGSCQTCPKVSVAPATQSKQKQKEKKNKKE